MRTPVLIGLAVVTVVAVGAAAAVVRDRGPSSASAAADTFVFPSVAAKPDEIAQIVVARADGGYTLTRKGEQWVFADRADYPARNEQVKQAAAALATLKLMEPKTQKPELLARLEVEEPTKEGAKSLLVTLKGAQGQEIGRIILGKARPDSLENPRPGVYVRKPGDARAWLAEGDPKIKAQVSDWLDRQVLGVKTDRVREIATVAPDGARVVVARDKAEDKDFKIADLPEGAKVKNQSALNDLGGLLDSLMMDDVQGAAAIAFPAGGASRAEYRTFDGLVVRLTLADDKGATWARVEASAEPWAKSEGGQSTMVEPAEEVRKEAADLNARLRSHVFKLTDYTAKKLVSRLADLTEKDEKKG